MSSAGLEEMEKQMPRTAGKPVVSIGMPVYNAERYLARAVDSLLKQDYADFELILSDNASTDGTWTLCREYAERDKRVRIYQNERNRGAVENFKRVCDAARGDYFMWAAADDYWLPGFVSALVKALEADPSAGVAMTAFERVREDGTIQDAVRFEKWNPNRLGYLWMMLCLASSRGAHHVFIYGLFRASLINAAMRHSIPQVPGGDRVFMCQVALATRFRFVDELLHRRMVHDRPSPVRLPDDPINRLITNDRWGYMKSLWALGSLLLRSNIIPWRRKLYAPLAMLAYMAANRRTLYRAV